MIISTDPTKKPALRHVDFTALTPNDDALSYRLSYVQQWHYVPFNHPPLRGVRGRGRYTCAACDYPRLLHTYVSTTNTNTTAAFARSGRRPCVSSTLPSRWHDVCVCTCGGMKAHEHVRRRSRTTRVILQETWRSAHPGNSLKTKTNTNLRNINENHNNKKIWPSKSKKG